MIQTLIVLFSKHFLDYFWVQRLTNFCCKLLVLSVHILICRPPVHFFKTMSLRLRRTSWSTNLTFIEATSSSFIKRIMSWINFLLRTTINNCSLNTLEFLWFIKKDLVLPNWRRNWIFWLLEIRSLHCKAVKVFILNTTIFCQEFLLWWLWSGVLSNIWAGWMWVFCPFSVFFRHLAQIFSNALNSFKKKTAATCFGVIW